MGSQQVSLAVEEELSWQELEEQGQCQTRWLGMEETGMRESVPR